MTAFIRRYIGTLELEEAKENVLRYGPVLLSQAPEETTDLLVRLCTDYKPSNAPVIKEVRHLNSILKAIGKERPVIYLL